MADAEERIGKVPGVESVRGGRASPRMFVRQGHCALNVLAGSPSGDVTIPGIDALLNYDLPMVLGAANDATRRRGG